MFDVNKYNKGEGAKFNYKLPEGAPYKKLSELGEGATFTVKGLFISTKGKFGDSPIALSDGMGVYLPAQLNSTVKEMINDPECVQAINEGRVGCQIYSYVNEYGTNYSVNWVNITQFTA